MLKTSASKLLFLMPFLMVTLPCNAFAAIKNPTPSFLMYDWGRIIFFSLIVFLTSFLVWLVSPLGIVFIIASLVQSLVSQKIVRIIAWVFQGLAFLFTVLLGIIIAIFSLSLYGEQKYMILFGIISSLIVICLLMTGTVVAQLIWQRNKTKSE